MLATTYHIQNSVSGTKNAEKKAWKLKKGT